MAQSSEFFALLFDFARALAQRVDEPTEVLVWRYTPLPKSLGIGEPFDQKNETWADFIRGLLASDDMAEFAYRRYATQIGPDPQLGDETFHSHRLFGPFYYEMRRGGVVRPHIAKLQPHATSPIDLYRQEGSRQQLGAMFRHIKETEAGAQTVLGNSWMYNIRAYRELYPTEFTAELPESTEDEFQFLAMWGQFFDREWRVRPGPARRLLEAVGRLEKIEDLRLCFPFQVLTPRCPIEPFYAFYGVAA